MSEEFDRAKWTMPPALPVFIAMAVVAALIAVASWYFRRPVAKGGIETVTAVELADHKSVLVAITVNFANATDKTLYLKSASAALATDGGSFTDDAASIADFDRYFQAFPDLRQGGADSLKPETKVPPGGAQRGMIIVSFPVNKDTFDKRKSLAVTVVPYDQLPVELVQGR